MTEKDWESFLAGAKAIAKAKYSLTDEELADRLHISIARLRRMAFADWRFSDVLRLLKLAGLGAIPEINK